MSNYDGEDIDALMGKPPSIGTFILGGLMFVACVVFVGALFVGAWVMG